MMFKNFFITGYPGSGKTTIFSNIIGDIKHRIPHIGISGFITREIREKGFRVSRTHFCPTALKTNASFSEINEII